LKDSYQHLRRSYQSLSAAAAATRLILDTIPDGPVDIEIFKTYGRFLRDSEVTNSTGVFEWYFVAFWGWLAAFMGFGKVEESLHERIKEKSDKLLELWQQQLASSEPNFKHLFEALAQSDLPKITLHDRGQIYQRWLQSSGLQWPFYERTYLTQ
jgi:hypothetical protein